MPALTGVVIGKFMNSTISSFGINGNWNEQSSLLNVNLVDDPLTDDDFLLGEQNSDNLGGKLVGTPFHFSYNGFNLDAILQSFDKDVSMEGNPIYKVVLGSPVQVLDSVQVILDGYVGPGNDRVFNSATQAQGTFQVSNFLNVYGYAEAGGAAFGRSQVSPVGYYWNGTYGIKNVLETLTNITPPVTFDSDYFGCNIFYKHNLYRLDLSGLPVPPDYYTIGGVINMTLLELINRFCQDAGVDYLIQLAIANSGPHTISFKTIPRYIQPTLRQISTFISQQTDINRFTHGEEIRPDITQAMIVGGQVSFLQPLINSQNTAVIMPFWGFDFEGNPIIGQTPRGTNFADDDHAMNLNCSSIADIAGELGIGLSYPSTILELRCALANYDTWQAFIKITKPNIATQLGLYGAYDLSQIKVDRGFEYLIDMLMDSPAYARQLSVKYGNSHWPAVAHRLYEYVKEQADTYYGRQFIALLPFNIQIKVVPQTFQVQFSDELADAGFSSEGTQPLGLNFLNENFFLDDTGRFYPFVRFPFVNNFYSVGSVIFDGTAKQVKANYAYGSSNSTIAQIETNIYNTKLFSRCEQGVDGPVLQNGTLGGGSPIFYIPNSAGLPVPAMVVTVPQPIFAQADDRLGSAIDLAAMLGAPDANTFINALNLAAGPMNMFIVPPALYPDGIAVALKSNQFVYGPWGKFRENGKLEFEQDDGLTPWDCGSYDIMNQIANAKLATIATSNQILERANITVAGVPQYSLFDTFYQDGPIINGIQCDIGTNGVTTTYNLETFVNRIGAFSRENADRLKRIGKIYQQLRRNMRQQIIARAQRASIMQDAYKGFMYGTTYALQEHTPHAVLGGSLQFSQKTKKFVPFAFTETYHESVGNIKVTNPDVFLNSACMGMEGLLRPFTMDVGNSGLPWYVTPDSGVKAMTSSITNVDLNPFQKGMDISWILSGNEYQTLNHRVNSSGVDFGTIRAMALRGPALMCGFGFDIQGQPVPNLNASGASTGKQYHLQDYGPSFADNYLTECIDWPVGPISLHWNKFNGTWMSPGMILVGTISGSPLNPGGVSNLRLTLKGKDMDETVTIYNHFLGPNAVVATGVRCIAAYNPIENRLYAISADC